MENKWNYKEFGLLQKSFNSEEGEIKYIDKGSGPVILLLHGVPSSSWLYRKMIDGLVTEGYRVIAPDMLGFGNSANPDGYEIYDQTHHAKRLLALMDALEIQKWTHVMHDAGGLWTWELLKQDSTKISKLVLLNTIIYEEGFQPPIRMKPGAFTRFSMWLYKNGLTTNTMLNQLFKKGLKENDLTVADIEGYRKPLRKGKTNAMYYFFSQTCNELPNYKEVIKNINIPTAIIWGKHDEMLQLAPQREEVMQDLKVAPKDVHLIDAKHFIQEEKPKEINSIILEFLKG